MRTTLDLDEQLLRQARKRAQERGTSLTAFIESALAAALAERSEQAEPYRLTWKTHRGELVAGVDLADRDSLFERMDGRG
jgi:hypothetical protein